MIKEFVDLFMSRKNELELVFKEKHPENYKEIVEDVVGLLTTKGFGGIDKDRIHEIDDGSCQGTLLYIIAEKGYQPDDYWYVKVGYGSCSGCDTLEGIRGYNNEPPNDEQVKDYMTLALHIVQGLRKMGDEVI